MDFILYFIFVRGEGDAGAQRHNEPVPAGKSSIDLHWLPAAADSNKSGR